MVDKRDLPRVLVVGTNAWREDGTAHTLMDIFRCWDPDKVALVYSRSDLPNTQVCKHFFQISENEVIQSVIRPWKKVGREVVSTQQNITANAEQARYRRAHKKRRSWMLLARECVWKFGHWKTAALRKFVREFEPDLLFIPIYPTVYMGWIQKYIIRLSQRPTVCYLADDNYSYDSCQNVCEYIHRFWLRQQVGPIARGCHQMFVIVDKEKEDTDSRFGTHSVILTKSVDFTGKSYHHHEPNKPLKFIYTGSLVIGRDLTLAMLADTINDVNEAMGEVRAEMYVYSQTEPKDEILARINRGSAHFCGYISREDVKKVQQEADVVVFAEALKGREANVAKLSFSTKITDYISNGKCVLAIGKDYIAPIDYFKRNDSALIVHSEEDMKTRIEEIVANPMITDAYGEKAFNCAVRNHEKNMMNKRFIETMLNVWKMHKNDSPA